jgi:hypothetical protein
MLLCCRRIRRGWEAAGLSLAVLAVLVVWLGWARDESVEGRCGIPDGKKNTVEAGNSRGYTR